MTSPTLPAGTGARKRALVLLVATVLPVGVYAALASRLIAANVGYQMDEALYVQPALFLLRRTTEQPPAPTNRASWITGWKKLPLMIMPYVGAAKAYVALPLFRVFGIDARVARWSGALFGALGIGGLAFLVTRLAGPRPGLVTGLLLAVHRTYLDLIVFDNGGVSVWMAAMGALALALAYHLRLRTPASAYVLGLAGGLGVWARLNVVWLLAAVAAAAALVLGRRALPSGKEILAAVAGGLAGALPLALYEIRSAFWTIPFVGQLRKELTEKVLTDRVRSLAELMIADGEQRTIWAGPAVSPWQLALGGLLLLVALGALFLPGRSPRSDSRRALSACTLVLTAILLASRLAVSQHHLVAVLPLAVATLVILGFEVGAALPRTTFLLVPAAAALAAISLSEFSRVEKGVETTGGKAIWSRAMYDVAKYLQERRPSPGRLKILSWGIQNGLYVVTRGEVVGEEVYWNATDRVSSRGRTWESELQEGGVFVAFAFPIPPFAGAAAGFERALANSRGRFEKRVFVDRSGSPVALVVTVP